MPQIDIDGAASRLSADNIRGQSGSTITIVSGHSLSGSGSGLTALPAANLTGTLPAISGTNLTNLNATNLASGTVPTARLGSGTANSSVHLRGDGTWAAAGGGKILAFHNAPSSDFGTTTISGTNNTWTDTAVVIALTPTSTASKFLVYYGFGTSTQDSGTDGGFSCRIKKVQDSTTTYPGFLSDYASGNLHSSYYANSQNDTPARWNIYYNFQGVDSDSHTTNPMVYTVQVGQYNISTLNVGNYYSARSQITVLEVSTT